ncbi:SH3 domain-containing protein [Streptomyces muensis]|uniref:SH3 domain-containing protein n=1 Tax=Streptomyces muensis TaxID=1077944 RepID=A0A9X1QB07_STRM4|nr:SH3 domain-containing protein [Streptomyces muensis]MCF1600501.1 SH3 domain-containing protein [Streptomyces muensis]
MSTDRVEGVERTEEVGDTGTEEAVTTMTATASASALRYYSVAPGVRLNVRRGPGTNYAIVRVLPEGAQIQIFCQTPGTYVAGPYGTSNIWDNIDDGEFVSDAYVNTGSDGYVRPRCSF